MTLHEFKISIKSEVENPDTDDALHDCHDKNLIINVDGHNVGVKILCYYDEDGTQIIDVFETVPLLNRNYRIAYIADGQETKIYKSPGSQI